MKTIIVHLSNDRELEVVQLPLRRYAELLKAVREIPKLIGGLDGLSNDKIFEQLPELIATAYPEVRTIVTIATKLEAKEIDELGLNDLINIAIAIIEVNQYKEVFDKIKKVMAKPQEMNLKAAKNLIA